MLLADSIASGRSQFCTTAPEFLQDSDLASNQLTFRCAPQPRHTKVPCRSTQSVDNALGCASRASRILCGAEFATAVLDIADRRSAFSLISPSWPRRSQPGMNSKDGIESKVFRLRQLPSWASTRTAARRLISRALDLASDHVALYSIAQSSDTWEAEPTWVATVQLKKLPSLIKESREATEWEIRVSARDPARDPGSPNTGRDENPILILDSHFEGMTVLNDVDPAIHRAEYVPTSLLPPFYSPCRASSDHCERFQLHCYSRPGEPSLWILAASWL